MFRDNSLIPSEAVRLAALGLLAEGPRHYGDLAAEIRHFTSRIAGPSLDLMGTSLELLRFEGLIVAAEPSEDALLSLTPAGRTTLQALLQAHLRAPLGDYNRLVLLLKLRFIHLLPDAERQEQMALIAESMQGELARLEDLRLHHAGRPGPFRDWLDQDIAALKARLAPPAAQ